jgi:hypothetical protein
MLYRPLAYLVYEAAKMFGYAGNGLGILQIMNAVAGAIGAGLCYLVFRNVIESKVAALCGTLWLATSLKNQIGVSIDDMPRSSSAPAFTCNGVSIFKL